MNILGKIEELKGKLSNAANQITQHSSTVQQLQGYMVRIQEEIKELTANAEATDSNEPAEQSAEQQVSAA